MGPRDTQDGVRMGWRLLRRWGLLCCVWLWPTAWAQPLADGAQVVKLGHQFARGSLPDRVAQRMAQQVAQASQQKVTIQVFAAATFGDEREHLALLRRGALDLAITGDLVISSLDTAYLAVNMPFLYRDVNHAMATYAGPIGQDMRAAMAGKGLETLSWHHVGVRVLTANRPVRGIDELKGLKLRLPPDAAWVAVWNALGANTQQLPFTELPAALKLGKVEAQENPPNFIRANKLHQHQKYLMTTHHMPQRQFVLASQARWQQLPQATRDLLAQAATEASRWAIATAEAEERKDIEWLLTEGGMTRVPFDAGNVVQRLDAVANDLGGNAARAIYQRILATK